MRPEWNPVRRSRNIGTAKQGHGQDNCFIIPQARRRGPWFLDALGADHVVTRKLNGSEVVFGIQPPRRGWFYPCTVADVVALLRRLPTVDLALVTMVLFRQPTAKQRVINPVWGRSVMDAELGRRRGAVIILEAQTLGCVRWPHSLTPDQAEELERLRRDGHRVLQTRRHHLIESTPEAMRATQLYRTLLHELGHVMDYRARGPSDYARRPSLERETFAHTYAERIARRLHAIRAIPYAPMREPAGSGIPRRYFSPGEAPRARLVTIN